MTISPSVTATVSLSASAGELVAGADDVEVLASALLEAALLDGALLDGAASVAPSSPEQPLSRPMPRARTSGAAWRGGGGGGGGWGRRGPPGGRGSRPPRGTPPPP